MAFERFLIPPYLLRQFAESVHDDVSGHAKELARQALDHFEKVAAVQVAEFQRVGIAAFINNESSSRDSDDSEDDPEDNPEDKKVRKDDPKDKDGPKKAPKKDPQDKKKPKPKPKDPKDKPKSGAKPKREVCDMAGSQNEFKLPGKVVRTEDGDKATASDDRQVNEVFDNVGRVLAMYKDKFDWTGVDNNSKTTIVSSIHFGKEYENACK